MLISPAYAQAAAPASGGDFLVSMLPLIMIFVVFYFLLIRPQQRRAKEHRAMIEAVQRGDQVITAGGLHGKVVRVEDAVLTVEIAKDVQVKVSRGTIADVPNKTAPPSNDNKGSKQAAAGGTGGFMNRIMGKK